jgi:hypothetical protein
MLPGRGAPLLSRTFSLTVDPQIFRSVAGLEGCHEPSRPLSSAGPGLRRRQGISVFGKHLWVSAPRLGLPVGVLDVSDDFDPIQLFQAGFQLAFLRDDLVRKYFGELLVECPKLFEFQCAQIRLTHRRLVTVRGNQGGFLGARERIGA